MKFLILLIPLLALAACAPLFSKTSPGPSILFVGNSYSFGVPLALKKLCSENGRSLRVGHSTNGGWTLAQHAAHQPTLNKIRSGKWNIVVFQEHSLIPGSPDCETSMIPSLQLLVEEARKAGSEPVLYQTWGRRDTFTEMNPKVREGYVKAAKACGIRRIVPVGDYWERELSSDLYHEDGSHPSPAGDRLTARAFYDTLCR
jgi:hypothetical protein